MEVWAVSAIHGAWYVCLCFWPNTDQRSFFNTYVDHVQAFFFFFEFLTHTQAQPHIDWRSTSSVVLLHPPSLSTVPLQGWWTWSPVGMSMCGCPMLLCSDQTGRKLSPVFISSEVTQPTSCHCVVAKWIFLTLPRKEANRNETGWLMRWWRKHEHKGGLFLRCLLENWIKAMGIWM